MMMMMLGLVCCCCVALSGTLGGLYFLHDGFKNWVNGLFGKGANDNTNMTDHQKTWLANLKRDCNPHHG